MQVDREEKGVEWPENTRGAVPLPTLGGVNCVPPREKVFELWSKNAGFYAFFIAKKLLATRKLDLGD